MKIKDANDLYKKGDYQGSLVAYIEISQSTEFLSNSISCNIAAARRKLHKNLISLASQSTESPGYIQATDNVEAQLAPVTIPAVSLETGQGHGQARVRTFWRLDCAATGSWTSPLSVSEFLVFDRTIHLGRSVEDTGGSRSAVFYLEDLRCFSDRFTGITTAAGTAAAWSVRRLSEREFVANRMELAQRTLGYRSETRIPSEIKALEEWFCTAGFTTSGAKAEDPFLRLLLLKYQGILASWHQPSEMPKKHEFPDSNGITVQDRHRLGSGVNFFLEGAKYFHGLLVIHGWILDPMASISSMRARAGSSGVWHDLLDQRALFPRPDVDRAFGVSPSPTAAPGFAVCEELDYWPCTPGQVEVVISSQVHGTRYVETLEVVDLSAQENGLEHMLGIIPEGKVTEGQCRHFYHPLFFKSLIAKSKAASSVFEFVGRSAKQSKRVTPTVSIIIPLYGPKRFETTQLPVLASLQQPDWQIILAVDDPTIKDEVLDNAQRLSLNYSVNLKVVCVSENLGFSGINNLASGVADGQYLLFLNSDCFITCVEPVKKALTWLGKDESHGSCGFRLQYADMRIQHDGMSDGLLDGDPLFHLNLHPRIGLLASSAPTKLKNDPARLLTAACLIMKRTIFKQIGGFEECYLRGDFEDSDICLKLLSLGKKLGIVRQPGIFHLERQSISIQESGLRQRITLVNSWIYSTRWGSILKHSLPELELVE